MFGTSADLRIMEAEGGGGRCFIGVKLAHNTNRILLRRLLVIEGRSFMIIIVFLLMTLFAWYCVILIKAVT